MRAPPCHGGCRQVKLQAKLQISSYLVSCWPWSRFSDLGDKDAKPGPPVAVVDTPFPELEWEYVTCCDISFMEVAVVDE